VFDDHNKAEKTYEMLKNTQKTIILTKTHIKPRIEVAKNSGFCFGVERSIDCALKVKGPASSIGPLVHNQHVVDDLAKKGITVVEDHRDASHKTAIIRAHGVPKPVISDLKKRGIGVVDLTCPFVKKVHEYATELENKGYKVIVIGEKNHPEVEGIIGHVDDAIVIENPEQAKNLPNMDKIGVVVQTTQTFKNLEDTMHILKTKTDDIKLCNTICNATSERQEAASKLAKHSDIMIVIGGKNSGNTKRLKELCELLTITKHIESYHELDPEWFFDRKNIGITGGASTPPKIISLVRDHIEMIA
jgi:4-hydroxy-3-methylbut-2-enyl diphosphate reductase